MQHLQLGMLPLQQSELYTTTSLSKPKLKGILIMTVLYFSNALKSPSAGCQWTLAIGEPPCRYPALTRRHQPRLYGRAHRGAARAADTILDVSGRTGLDGYWIHLDADILDPGVMPAVDSPSPGGLGAAELTELLAALAPRAVGAQVTVFDPDLDPDSSHARLLTDILVTA